MIKNILKLSKRLIEIPSYDKNKEELKKILYIALSEIKNFNYQIFKKNNILSALGHNSKNIPKKFKIILNAHLDIIPGKESQYLPKINKDRLYGAGAMDMKASAACLILVFKEIAQKVNYPLGLQLVTDEEIGGFNGTKYQIDKGVRADFVIVGECTNLNIENESKGILWVKIFTKGKAAHGAYPWKGVNAIWKMNEFLNLLEKRCPVPNQEKWVTTINLSKIQTRNETFNKIPNDCEIWLDIRYVPEDTKIIINNIRKLLPPGFKLDIILNEPAQSTNKYNQYLRLLKIKTEQTTKKRVSILEAHGSSDLRHFSRVKCNGVEFGPIGGGMGSDNEWVDLKSLENYYHILKTFFLSLNN